MTDYWRDFVQESEEHITELNNSLLELERSPDDEEAIDDIFRIAHTLKGNCGAMGLTRASALAHAIEDLLDAIRSGAVEVDPVLMDTIFDGVDAFERMVDEVATDGEVRTDPSTTIDALRAPLEDVGTPADRVEGNDAVTDETIDALLARVEPPADDEVETYFVRLFIADQPGVNNGQRVVDALVDAFDLLATDPDREVIAREEYGFSFDAVFGSAVGERAIAAALEPVEAVADFEIETVTDRFDSLETEAASAGDDEGDEFAVGSNISSEEASELSVDELLEEFTEFDDLDALVEEVGDVGAFEDMGEAGSFDDLLGGDDDESESVDERTPEDDDAGAPDDAHPSDPSSADEAVTAGDDGDGAADDPDDEVVDDANAVFAELKEEVEMVDFDELQAELDELEFEEFDGEDEVDMDELLGDDVDVEDSSFLGISSEPGVDADAADDETADLGGDTFDLSDAAASMTDDDSTVDDAPSETTDDDEVTDHETRSPEAASTDVEEALESVEFERDDVEQDLSVDADADDREEDATQAAEADSLEGDVTADADADGLEEDATATAGEDVSADADTDDIEEDLPAEDDTDDLEEDVPAETGTDELEEDVTADAGSDDHEEDAVAAAEAGDVATDDGAGEANESEVFSFEDIASAGPADETVDEADEDEPEEIPAVAADADEAESADVEGDNDPTDAVDREGSDDDDLGGDDLEDVDEGDFDDDALGEDAFDEDDFDDDALGEDAFDEDDFDDDALGEDAFDEDDFDEDAFDDVGETTFEADFESESFGEADLDSSVVDAFDDEGFDATPVDDDLEGFDDEGFDDDLESGFDDGLDDDLEGGQFETTASAGPDPTQYAPAETDLEFGDASDSSEDDRAEQAADDDAGDGTGIGGPDGMEIPDITVPEPREEATTGDHAGMQSIRVDVEQVDSLLTLVEGLVTSRVRLRHAIESGEDLSTIDRELDDLEDLTSELQETVMDVRLVPFQTVSNRLPRVVRDISRDQEKEVTFERRGEDVELDRSILDRIGDPLIHLVRNAVDHGIEPPEEREAEDKPREGRVELRATRARDRVTIEVEDDGRGLDPDRLRTVATEAGVITESEADELEDDEALELVFHPGLSTADEVTDVSGRGVGMDIVKRTVDELDGAVSIESELGEGTTVTLELPVTVAIGEVLFVESGGEEFGIPLKVVQDVDSGAVVRTVDGEPVLVDGGVPASVDDDGDEVEDEDDGDDDGDEVEDEDDGDDDGDEVEGEDDGDEAVESDRVEIPVIDLAEVLGTAAGAAENGDGMIVRVRDEIRPVGLRCDDVRGQQEVVIKPFEGFMSDIPGLSGATVRGRGEVVNILDVNSL